MKAGAGKNKGSSFERSVCKDLSRWVSGGKRTDLFARSASSGGMATAQMRFGHRNRTQGGDICAVGEQGIKLCETFSIECKHVRDLMIWQGVSQGFGNLVRFWKQARKDASAGRKVPLLIACQNRVPTIVVGRVTSLQMLVPLHLIVVTSTRVEENESRLSAIGIVLFEELLKQPCPFS